MTGLELPPSPGRYAPDRAGLEEGIGMKRLMNFLVGNGRLKVTGLFPERLIKPLCPERSGNLGRRKWLDESLLCVLTVRRRHLRQLRELAQSRLRRQVRRAAGGAGPLHPLPDPVCLPNGPRPVPARRSLPVPIHIDGGGQGKTERVPPPLS